MAPRQSRKSPSAFESESEEDSQPVSTEQNTVDMLRTAKSMVDDGKKRRVKKRKAIENSYDNRVKEVETKIDTLFAVRKSRVTKNQKALWTRLEKLNTKREKLERLILASMLSIEEHTINIAVQMEAVFAGRMEDIEGGK
ncbi:hypothetical protein LSUB1_G003436 [Lachnellula subtilissima]|uniref:Uncharacterized protein n=1 Tax=Lachnellula subtilissima TaxID=602034 RepID=A0A8H8RMR8_9HELO|nr:hypothetical protein LSUB1_G003436 [Lachnellula subtilissima]